jgi:hypothetical protein
MEFVLFELVIRRGLYIIALGRLDNGEYSSALLGFTWISFFDGDKDTHAVYFDFMYASFIIHQFKRLIGRA